MLSRSHHEIRTIVRLSLPLIAAFLAQKAMQFIDTLMMGWIGPDALAAGALSVTTYMTILVFCRGLLSAVGVAVAQSRGTDTKHQLKPLMQHGCYIVMIISVPCMLLIWYSPALYKLAGQNHLVVENSQLLLHALVFGFPGMLSFFLYRELISAFALTRIVMLVSLLSIPLTFAANYVLIYGKYGFPQLGIAGIGYAGSIIMWLMFFMLWIFCKWHEELQEVVSFKSFTWQPDLMMQIIKVGIPSGIIIVIDAVLFLAAAIMMGYFGINELASYQIAMQFASIAYNIPFAVAVITGLQIGQAIGAKDYSLAKHYAYSGLFIAFCISLIIGLIFVFAPNILINLFTSTNASSYTAVSVTAKSYLAISALFLFFDAFQSVFTGILKGFNDTFIPMVLFIICYCFAGLGSAYYFAFHTTIGAIGIFYGLTLGIACVAILLGWRLLSGSWYKSEYVLLPT